MSKQLVVNQKNSMKKKRTLNYSGKRTYAFALVFALGLILLLVGLFQGQPADVLAKAIRICLECVGIG